MKVLKFGGTSVGSVENMSNVKNIINDGKKKIVVLSAMSGTTNALVAIASNISNNIPNEAIEKINKLHETYFNTIDKLLCDESLNADVKNYVTEIFNFLVECTYQKYSLDLENRMVAQGELLSTYIFHNYLKQEGVKSALLPALNFMRIDKNKEPDLFYIQQDFEAVFKEAQEANIYITQGFICLDEEGNISNLQRGGSDYTATIIGAVIKAEEVEIWTDIDGMHNNDPRYVENTKPISNLSFDEAAELAYFGAKILHPQTVTPVRADNIPVRLKNTMNPEVFGTLINDDHTENGVKAIAAKDNITAIKIKSGRMLLAHGFLRKVFEIFEVYETAIDMITTSEVAVSVTIDNDVYLANIVKELEPFGSVEVEKEQSIVSIVGNHIAHTDSVLKKLFNAIDEVPVTMVSYGGSAHNISLLVPTADRTKTLQLINSGLFGL